MSTYKSTRIIGVARLTEFFAAVDRHLTGPAKIVIIGGSAAAFHGATSLTNDVDTLDRIDGELESAIERARTEGFDIPVGPAGVAQVPYNSEDRLVRCLPELRRADNSVRD